MSTNGAPPPATAPEEISALIATLHATGQRLEELTGGEVDTVADREGRSFLLRHAQEHLRQSEAVRQAAIVDALPANVALLDTGGIVVSVNQAWRTFGAANGLQGPPDGIGANYLEICDRAAAAGVEGAQEVATGIVAVLTGQASCFSIEYGCHSPWEERWFLMSVAPLDQGALRGVVVMHVNVTERKRAEHLLIGLEEKYRTVFESSNDAIMLMDQTGFVDVNAAAVGLFGLSARTQLIGKHPVDLSPSTQPGGEDSGDLAEEYIGRASRSGQGRFEWMFRRADGVDFLADVLLTIMKVDGKAVLQGTVRDITHRKRVADEIAFANTILKTQQETSLDAILVVGQDERILSFNQRFVDLWQLPPDLVKAGLDAPVLQSAADQVSNPETFAARVQYLNDHQEEGGLEEIVLKDGRVLDRYSTAAIGGDQKYYGRVWYFRDITERKMAEEKIVHLSRVHAMLSGISTAIVRAQDRRELFKEACEIAVREGGFCMALVATVDPELQRIVAVASAGKDEGLLGAVEALLSSPELAPTTMIAKAIRQMAPVVSNDSQADNQVLLRNRYAGSAVRSIAILPLIVSGEAIGALALYSSKVEFFHEREMDLLTTLANDIAFGLHALRTRTERGRALEALRSLLKEKEALLKEVHHRVKNNMQVITSLLRLESSRIDHPTTKTVLKDMQNRIQAMAALHEAIYRSNDFSRVDLGSYLRQLANQLGRSLVAVPGQISFHFDLHSVGLDLDQAVPCGLMVNELVSNALKHAFPNGRAGEVRIELKAKGPDEVQLSVSDNGIGLPENFAARRSDSLGLQLVSDLARQLGGRLHVGPGPQALFEVTFSPHPRRPEPLPVL